MKKKIGLMFLLAFGLACSNKDKSKDADEQAGLTPGNIEPPVGVVTTPVVTPTPPDQTKLVEENENENLQQSSI